MLGSGKIFLCRASFILCLLASGCLQPPASSRLDKFPSRPESFSALPAVHRSENERVGTIQQVDQANRFVLIKYAPGAHPRTEGRLIAIDANLEPTAVLEISNLRRGNAVAALILAGVPQPGDSAVAPGARLRHWGEAQLSKQPQPH